MKTIYKSIFLTTIAFCLTVSVCAQTAAAKDTTLNRQVVLERDFDPTLKDASKINTLPAIHESVVPTTSIQYENRQPNLTLNSFPVGDTGSGDIKMDVGYSKKKGYLTLAGGTNANIRGTLGYKILDTASDELDVYARHSSTNGNIKYAEKGYTFEKTEAKYMNNMVKATYQHSFDYLKWRLSANFENTSFNYYGNPFNPPYDYYDFKNKQSITSYGIETGVKSRENNEFIYDGSLSFNHFTSKYGPSVDIDGVDGNIIDAKFDMAAPFESDKKIGIRVGIMNQTFSNVKAPLDKNGFHSLTKLQFNPYFNIEGENYFVSLGINANYAIEYKNKLGIAPDIKASWQFVGKTSLYLTAKGGINENDFLSIMKENRYVYSGAKVQYSNTLVDAQIGIKSGIVKGLEFDIFAGYKHTKDEHLYVVTGFMDSFRNMPIASYFDLGTGHFGGLLKTNLIPYTDLSAKLVAYFYNVSGKSYNGVDRLFEAWNLPAFTFNLNADVNAIDNLILSASYSLATGRKAEFEGQKYSMKNISELNFRGEYQLTDWISVNAQLNNALNQKYESWYGYTHQGMNIMGGVSLKF